MILPSSTRILWARLIKDEVIEKWFIKTSRHRLDSTVILSNMKIIFRQGLFIRTIEKFLLKERDHEPETSFVDGGFVSGENIVKSADEGINLLVPLPGKKPEEKELDAGDFTFDESFPENNNHLVYFCV
jgi:hypothetical protein